MKRSSELKRSALPRPTKPLRRTRLRFRSKRTAKVYREQRVPLVAELLGEFAVCQFPDCARPAVDVHELLSRARGGSITDRVNLRCLCRAHHDFITTHPTWAELTCWALSARRPVDPTDAERHRQNAFVPLSTSPQEHRND